jgi:ABC-2 type transport system permease protein
VALSWLAAALGPMVHSVEAANGITFFISFLSYPSSAFVPIHTMPSWLQGVAQHQPITVVIDAIRRLLDSAPVGAAAWEAVVWSGGVIAASVLLAGVFSRRRTR